MMSGPVVLCVAGSPRRHGNSDQFLEAAIAGIESEGGEARTVVAATSDVTPCRGCNGCSRAGTCVVRDGMDAIYQQIDEADALLISTPVFFATVPAVLKTLYDRFQPYWARRYVLHEPLSGPRRPAALIVVGGGGDPYGMDCVVTPTRSILGPSGFELVDLLKVEGLDVPSDARTHPDELERARSIGAELVRQARQRRS